MSRPLGAQLPPDERAAALEERVRAYQAAVDELEDALYSLDTGADADGRKVRLEESLRAIRRSIVALQELKAAPIRALKRSAPP